MVKTLKYEVVFPHVIKGYDYNGRVLGVVEVDRSNQLTMLEAWQLLKEKMGNEANRCVRFSVDVAI